MMGRLLLLFLLFVAGCASGPSVPADPLKMTPEQLKEYVKDRNANISCVAVQNLTGSAVVTWVVLDKGPVLSGGVSVGANCEVSIVVNPPPAKE